MTRPSRLVRPLVAASAALALLVTAACGGGGDGGGEGGTSGAQQAKGPITIWYSNNEAEVAWGKKMVAAWNAANADQQITGQEIPAGKSSEEVIGAAVTAGTAPCLIFNTAPSAVGQFQRQGGLVDLSTFPDGASYIETRSGEVAQQYKSPEGGYYQLPWKSNPVMIFYNKAILAKAGLGASPKISTYDEFLAAARTIKSSKAAQYAIWPAPTSEFFQTQFDFMPLFAAETKGQGLIVDGKATFADQAGLDVAGFWKTIYAEGLAGKETYNGDAFAAGKAAMAIVGPWAVSVYKGKVDWGSVPVPTKAGTPAADTWTFSDAKNVGLYTACQNQGTAWEVLKFATSQDQDGALLSTTGQMPLRADLQTVYADYFTKNPAYKVFGDQTARVIEVPAGPNTVEMLQTIRDAYTKAVIAGEGDLAAQFKAAADKATELASG